MTGSRRTIGQGACEGPGRAIDPLYPFSCKHLTSDDIEQTARVYTDVFLNDEPTSRRHALDREIFLPYARFYVDVCVRKKLSFIAIEKESLNVIGFILCSDLTTDWDSEGKMMMDFLSHFHETLVAIDELEGRYFDRTRISRGRVLHVFQIGVIREFRGRSVSTTLIRRVLIDALERGYLQVVADCTSPLSSRSFERCGFYEAGSISYDDLMINGSRFFNGLDGAISLMVKDL